MEIRDVIDAIQANRVRITDHADEEAEAELKRQEVADLQPLGTSFQVT